MKMRSLIVCFLVLHYSIVQSAVFPDTLIKTPDGLVTVEKLQRGQYVLDQNLKKVRIRRILTKKINAATFIKTEKGILAVSPEQKLYDPVLKKWIVAAALTQQNKLLDHTAQHINCIDIKTASFDSKLTSYELSLENPHTFFLSDAQILAHNFIPAISIGIALTFDTVLKGVTIAALGIGIGIAGIWGFAKVWQGGDGNIANIGGPLWSPQLFPGGPDDNDPKSKTVFWFAEKTIKLAVEFAFKENRFFHFFNKPEHNLAPLLKIFGEPEKVVFEVLRAAHGKLPLAGKFGDKVDFIVNVAGFDVCIRGAMVDGIPRLSTLFIKMIKGS